VPGAFMSLLNISYLNELIVEKNISSPANILNEQRKQIIKALNPKGNENSQDGMDCVLCEYDLDHLTLTFAAANNSLWIVRNNSIIEFKGNKMPVGKHLELNDEFTEQSVVLEHGDVVYTFTDGVADQFGGEDGKKFKYKQLADLLLSVHHLPMVQQKELIEKAVNTWKGNREQTDDMLIVGVKI
jgi:serine phosphatase RsbU (regulator of sigma subunit)